MFYIYYYLSVLYKCVNNSSQVYVGNILCIFREYLVNENITYNDNDTLTYIPRRKIVYVPEMSIGDPMEDIINVPNVPFLVSVIIICFITSILHRD